MFGTITVTAEGLDDLVKRLREVSPAVSRDFGTVSWEVGKYGRSQIAKECSQEINLPQNRIKKVIHAKKLRPVGAVITVPKEKRYPLREFKPKSMKKGVKAKVNKKRPPRYYHRAFMGPRPGVIAPRLGGHAFEREGKARTPIYQAMGISPWGVLIKNEMLLPSIRFKLRKRLEKELKKRIQRRLDGYIKG